MSIVFGAAGQICRRYQHSCLCARLIRGNAFRRAFHWSHHTLTDLDLITLASSSSCFASSWCRDIQNRAQCHMCVPISCMSCREVMLQLDTSCSQLGRSIVHSLQALLAMQSGTRLQGTHPTSITVAIDQLISLFRPPLLCLSANHHARRLLSRKTCFLSTTPTAGNKNFFLRSPPSISASCQAAETKHCTAIDVLHIHSLVPLLMCSLVSGRQT
jgi:hypothetical protein